MSASKTDKGRVPLSQVALRKVVGGQGDNGRERPDPTVLIEQSIVQNDAGAPVDEGGSAEALAMAAALAAQEPVEALESDLPDIAELEGDVTEAPVAGAMKPAAGAPAAPPAGDPQAEAAKAAAELDVGAGDGAAPESAKPALVAKAVKVEAGKVETPASKAASVDGGAVESMADDALPPLKAEVPIKAPDASEVEAQKLVKEAEAKVAAVKKVDAVAADPKVEALILTTVAAKARNLPADPTQDLKVSGALAYDPEKNIATARKLDAEGRDLAKKYDDARLKYGASSKEATAAAELLSKKSVERQAALLPADYKPHSRVVAANPWDAQAAAGDQLLRALKSGTFAEKDAAQKHYDAVKMPDDAAARERWFAVKQKQADITVKTLLLKKTEVETKLEALNKSFATAQNDLIKHNLEQSRSLANHYKDMRDMTKEARAFFEPRIKTFGELHKKFLDASLRVDMASAYRLELLKDIEVAQMDLARANQFVAANKQSAALPVMDLKSAGEAVTKAADLKDQKHAAAEAAEVKDGEARQATKNAIAAGEAASKEFTEKREAYRKIDPAADQRIKELEAKQRELKDANQIRGYKDMLKGSIDGHAAEIEVQQKKMDLAGRALGDAKIKLHAALQGVSDNWNWNEANGLTRFRASIDLVTTNVKNLQYVHSEYVRHSTIVTGYKAQLDTMKAELAAVGEKLDLARLPPSVAVKIAEIKVKQALAASREGDAKSKALLAKSEAAAKMEVDAKRKIDQSALQLRTSAVNGASKEQLKRIEAEISENWMEWRHAKAAAARAFQEHHGFVNSAENASFIGKIRQANDNLAAAQQWLKEGEAQSARDTAQVREAKIKATADLDSAWTRLQGSADATRKAIEAEQVAAANLFVAGNEAQKATFDFEVARNAERDVHIKQLKVYDALKQAESNFTWTTGRGLETAKAHVKGMQANYDESVRRFDRADWTQKLFTAIAKEAARNQLAGAQANLTHMEQMTKVSGDTAAKSSAYAKALASLSPALATIDAAMAADSRASARTPGAVASKVAEATPDRPMPSPEGAAKTASKDAQIKAAVKELNTKAKVDPIGDGRSVQYEKKSGEDKVVKKWGSDYERAVDKAKKDGKAVPAKADFIAKAQSSALEKMKSGAVAKSRELAGKLANDIAQDLLRTYAEKAGRAYKVGEDRVLAGQHHQTKLVNGTIVIDAVAQVSLETKAQAYVSNLGVYGAAGLGLKTDVGALLQMKTPMGGGVSGITEGRAYASAKIDLEAEGRVNVLGLAADTTAKATVMGELSGYSGFALGEIGSIKTGGELVGEASAVAKGGAKLGLDGLSLKGSAAVEAAARASYVQKATFAGADFHSAGEVWAKAKAEATASLSGGMVNGEMKFGGKLSAMAGAGAGIQETKKIKFLGMELEGTVGVQVGSLGGKLGADVSFKDGTLKWSLDVGAALGLGIDVKLAGSINFPAMVTAATKLLTDFVRAIDANAGQKLHVELLKMRMALGEKIWS